MYVRVASQLYTFCLLILFYRLWTFPGKTNETSRKKRLEWRILVNRREKEKANRHLTPRKQSRICSCHFVDKKPTANNPYPILNLGYEATLNVKKIVGSRRRLVYSKNKNDTTSTDLISEDQEFDVNVNDFEENLDLGDTAPISNQQLHQCDTIILPSYVVFRREFYANGLLSIMVTLASLLSFGSMFNEKCKDYLHEISNLSTQVELLTTLAYKNESEILKLRKQNKYLKQKLSEIKSNCTCKIPLHKKLLTTPKDCLFHTGIATVRLFQKLHDFIKPYVRRRWRGASHTSTKLKRKFVGVPKRMGPERKLPSSYDEFLLLMMRLRLGLFNEDLSKRFCISVSLTSSIIRTWLRATASCIGKFVFVPDQGILNIVKPQHFKPASRLHSIIDATEISIETPKGLINQRLTWSNYKHQNTLKILIACASNSTIVFVSKAYCGSTSDKALTNHCGYLDMIEPHTQLMADKGFNILAECNARSIELIIPPGKRGTSQMLTKDVQKTSEIAKMRILVEQVIRQLKSFHILANEIPISVIPQIDDIVIVCAGLINLLSPIYK